MQLRPNFLALSGAVFTAAVALATALGAAQAAEPKEDFVRAPAPPGFQVFVNELEGPVYADAQGRTLYTWPKRTLRNGTAGEDRGKPTCGSQPSRESSGTQSPYPGGFIMPEVETRPACTDLWPVAHAPADAKPVGKWTIVTRPDGSKQWAYDGFAVYTSALDKRPGDVLGGTDLGFIGEGGAVRNPIGAESNVPGQFRVHTTMTGRLVTLRDGLSVYTYDRDGRNKSNCNNECLIDWEPVLAATSATRVGEWTPFERSPGVLQWSFRGRPVYRYVEDSKPGSQSGSDIPGWRNVYTQMTPKPPAGFTVKPTIVGMGLGDANGMTVYRYVCTDDAPDQLSCDTPDAPQIYRFAMCGGGDPELCLKTFPYVIAPASAKTGNQVWGTLLIDPKTGKPAVAGSAGALNVYTFRGRPIYTFAGYKGYGDRKPTDINANGWGEANGGRNGYAAIIYRDIFETRDGYSMRGGGR